MSFYKMYKREIFTLLLFFLLGVGMESVFSRFWQFYKKEKEFKEAEGFPENEKFYMRKTGNITSPISVVEFWEMSTSRSFCVIAVNTNRDQNIQTKLYAAQIAMNCK